MAAKSTSKKSKGAKSTKKALLIAALIVGLTALYVAFEVFGPNTGSFVQGGFFYIHTGSDYEDVKEGLKEGGFVREIGSFDLIAKQAGYAGHIHPGKYKISKGMSNYQ